MSASTPITALKRLLLGWCAAQLLAACGPARLDVGQPPAQTLAPATAVDWQRSGDLSAKRQFLWGHWGGGQVDAAAVRMFGAATQPQALAAPALPAHPYLAKQNNNGMHGDSYAGKAVDWPAPLGRQPRVRSKSLGTLFGGECATVSYDRRGRIMAVCATFTSFKLYLLDAASLAVLAEHRLPLRRSNKTLQIRQVMTDTSGGAYHHLLRDDRPLIVNAKNQLQIFSVDDHGPRPVWRIEQSWELQPHLPPGHLVTDAMPDWAGNVWFVSRQGLVGVLLPRTGQVQTVRLAGEEIQNSFSVAADGVYIVSDRALYRMAADGQGRPVVLWRQEYANDRVAKPGVIGLGSGTTPTLLGDDWVAITDNASPQIHVTVWRRDNGQPVCQVPVFTPGRSVTDNGMIGYGNSLLVTNNYGYDTPLRPVWTEGGVARIDVAPDGSGCHLVWHSPEAAQTVVPKLSTRTGLVYLYTREPVPGYDPRQAAAYAWYLTALDFATGASRFKIYTGAGLNYNNNWAPITLSPWGTAYVGVLGGLIAIRDAADLPTN